MELYVYYRIAPEAWTPARAQVLAAQQELARRMPGLVSKLLRRSDAAGDGQEPLTVMETYAHPNTLSAAQCEAIESAMAAMPASRLGPRHAERFDDATG